MVNLGSNRKPAFLWQALLILLPVAVMAAIGWAAIVRDKAAVEQDARQRAQELLQTLASQLGPKTLSQLAEFDGLAGEWFGWQSVKLARLVSGVALERTNGPVNPSQNALAEAFKHNVRLENWERTNPGLRPEEVFPNWVWLDKEGQLAWPPNYEQPPTPPKWLLALTGEQRQLWEALQCARASTNSTKTEAARVEFLKAAPYSVPKANVDFLELERKSAQEEPGKSAAKFLLFAQQHPFVRTESGIPLSDLAIAAALRTARHETVIDSSWLVLFRLLLQNPSALTGRLLEQAQSVGQNDPVFRETRLVAENIWVAQERLRDAAEVLHQTGRRSGTALADFWIDISRERWFCLQNRRAPSTNLGPFAAVTQGTTPAIEVRLYPKTIVAGAVRSVVQATGISIPDYAALSIALDGVPLDSPAGDARSSSRSKLLAELQCPLSRSGVGASQEYIDGASNHMSSESEAPSRPAKFSLQLALVNSELLFARQRQRTRLFEGLILASAVAALMGLLAAYRAFRRQLRLNELKSNFVSSVSHELRAPIASVRLMAESLERGKIDDASKQKEYFHFIVQECRRLSSLIENVLDFSRIERGRKQYDFEPTDLLALTRQTVSLMETYAAEKKVRLSLVFPDQNANRSEFQSNLDGKAIQQALINLIDNALKHSTPGDIVTIGLQRAHADGINSSQTPDSGIPIQLWVQDNGSGIAPEEQSKIFERFYRSGSELRRETQGVGIGLSIVKHIVEAHRGTVRVRSAIGQGSRFTIELPSHLWNES